jgi:hypothetical protein
MNGDETREAAALTVEECFADRGTRGSSLLKAHSDGLGWSRQTWLGSRRAGARHRYGGQWANRATVP